MVNSLFFPALSTISPPLSGTDQKWRMCTKTSNTYDNFLTVEMVFRYYDNPSQFDITGKNMTLFHMGTDSTTSGVDIILRKGSNPTDPIELGYRLSDGTTWTPISSSFIDISAFVNSSAFYFMLSYDYSGSTNTNINFYVVRYNTNNYPTYDFSYINPSGLPIEPIGKQWGFGSLPQALVDINGYNNEENYNGYIAQNLQVNYLRTWNTVIPATSSTPGEYAMFNSVDPLYSLYTLNRINNFVPAGATNLNFQLYVPPSSTSLSQLANNAVNPPQNVNLATSSSNYPTLNPPSSYEFAVNNTSGLMLIAPSDIPCLLTGTKILTPTGYKLIEDLNVDDTVLTHDNREVKIIEVSKHTALGSDNTYPHIVRKGTYGAFEDLYLSRGHSILVENIFYHAFKLNLEVQTDNILYTYHCLKLENFLTDTLVANGVVVECWSGWTSENPVTNVPKEYITKEGNRIYKLDI